ncbi:unnamed protein product [Ectocarpus sp. 8 AP-2014]
MLRNRTTVRPCWDEEVARGPVAYAYTSMSDAIIIYACACRPSRDPCPSESFRRLGMGLPALLPRHDPG